MTDDKKKPEDETPKAQAEDAKPSENLSDDELSNAAGGIEADEIILNPGKGEGSITW